MSIKQIFALSTLVITSSIFPILTHQLKRDPRCVECNREFKSHADFYEHVQRAHLLVDDKTILTNEKKLALINTKNQRN